MLVGTMQQEGPPPAKVRATDFSIAAIMARPSPPTPPTGGDSCSDSEEVEVDVEECSESEVEAKPSSEASDSEGRESPAGSTRTRCNCQDLLGVTCHLETKELWDKFHELGTEMIITKTGRYGLYYSIIPPII
ncbi:unnamed protein product [Nezara viridula]|uniref:T-box domain-containing protein n=1 Tax=Nezara viridula TaxID=85310 RepID=A0A9P0GUK1_NEZVI|nr:unnamed protein product [Nezara viridula]